MITVIMGLWRDFFYLHIFFDHFKFYDFFYDFMFLLQEQELFTENLYPNVGNKITLI